MVQGDAKVITGGSAFNIKTKSLRMGNFTQTETQALWPQNTQATGQSFAPENFPQLWLDTESQPWLVKALGHEATWGCQPARDRSRPITLADSQQAREHLIYSRVTHPDQLCDKLRQPRVSSVMSAIIASKDDSNLHAVQPDHQPYVVDLGLIVTRPSVRISNRIYQEVIPRELTWVAQTRIANQEQSWYVTHDHRLDTPKLLAAFQQCFRQRSDIWSGGGDYKEEAPQLHYARVFAAHLQWRRVHLLRIRIEAQAHGFVHRMAYQSCAGHVRAAVVRDSEVENPARQPGRPAGPGANGQRQRPRGRRRGAFADLQPQPRLFLRRRDLASPGVLWRPDDWGVVEYPIR